MSNQNEWIVIKDKEEDGSDVIKDEDGYICDYKCQCKGCWDEFKCPWTRNTSRVDLISNGEVDTGVGVVAAVFDISKDELVKQEGIETEDGVFCLDQRSEEWIHIKSDDRRVCHKSLTCTCKGCWERLVCQQSKIPGGNQLGKKDGRQLRGGLTCVHRNNDWIFLSKTEID